MSAEDLERQLSEARRLERDAAREAKRQGWRAEHEAELEARRADRAAEREAKRREWKEGHAADYERADDVFERESAERMGLTVEAFRALQAERRYQMGQMAPLDEQLANLKEQGR